MGPRPKGMPCPVCNENVPVKQTHRGKPYWQCGECGVQVFISRQEGIKRLEESDKEADEHKVVRMKKRCLATAH